MGKNSNDSVYKKDLDLLYNPRYPGFRSEEMKMNTKFEVRNAQGGGWVVVFVRDGEITMTCPGVHVTHTGATEDAARRNALRAS
jgi:hypothetical protein